MDNGTIERLVAQHTAARVILVRQKEDKKRGDMYIRIKCVCVCVCIPIPAHFD